MKSFIVVIALLGLTACANMTPREKQTAQIVGAILIGAVIISANDSNNITVVNEGKPCHTHPKHHRCD